MNIKKYLFIICVFFFIIVSCFHISYAQSSYIWSDTSALNSLVTNSNSNPTDLKLESGGAILIEQSTGTVLYEHNSHEMFRPASVTKIMSLLLIMEAIDKRRNFFKR